MAEGFISLNLGCLQGDWMIWKGQRSAASTDSVGCDISGIVFSSFFWVLGCTDLFDKELYQRNPKLKGFNLYLQTSNKPVKDPGHFWSIIKLTASLARAESHAIPSATASFQAEELHVAPALSKVNITLPALCKKSMKVLQGTEASSWETLRSAIYWQKGAIFLSLTWN